jgi:hypothetical protein
MSESRPPDDTLTRLPLIPETLDEACHCGFYPEGGDPVYGSKCPIIEHRVRSGAQWRQHYIEEFNDSRELRAEVSRLREALKQWESWGIIEIAVRNQSVSDYMDHWEGRALKAEADVSRLQQENALLRRSLEMLTKQMAE